MLGSPDSVESHHTLGRRQPSDFIWRPEMGRKVNLLDFCELVFFFINDPKVTDLMQNCLCTVLPARCDGFLRICRSPA